jgi:exosortase/archaeosortase family protein
MLYLINICRLSLVLVAGNNNWEFPFGWDHHTWFNIFAYIAIFAMMYFFDRSSKEKGIIHKEKTGIQ